MIWALLFVVGLSWFGLRFHLSLNFQFLFLNFRKLKINFNKNVELFLIKAQRIFLIKDQKIIFE